MKKSEIARLARALMNQHGYADVPFEWGNTKRRLGAAFFDREGTPKKMQLSALIMPHLNEDEIRDVILHEIAHFNAGRAAGHGYLWRQAARAVGARPERTSDAVPQWVKERMAKYVLTCKTCGEESYMYRRPKGARYRHVGCGGSFDIRAKR